MKRLIPLMLMLSGCYGSSWDDEVASGTYDSVTAILIEESDPTLNELVRLQMLDGRMTEAEYQDFLAKVREEDTLEGRKSLKLYLSIMGNKK